MQRLKSKPEVLSHYNEVIQDQIAQEIVEPVEENINRSVGNVHYISHHEVIRVDKETTKLRVVYDASARERKNSPSLNDCLVATGPSLSPLIYDILLRFRVHKIAITGNIEKAFLNVSVDPRDRDYLRFFWVDDITSKLPTLQAYIFTRIPFGVSSSPFLLNATIYHHLTSIEMPREFAEKVLKSLYVNDFVSGDDSEESTFELYQHLKVSFNSGGFNMRKWASNSTALQRQIEQGEGVDDSPSSSVDDQIIQEEDQSFSSTLFESPKKSNTAKLKVLGIGWDTKKDLLLLNLNPSSEAVNKDPITKRAILSATSKLYDPLGLLSPVIIPLKMIFQSICKSKVDWDSPVNSFLQEQWLKLVEDMSKVGVVEIKRH